MEARLASRPEPAAGRLTDPGPTYDQDLGGHRARCGSADRVHDLTGNYDYGLGPGPTGGGMGVPAGGPVGVIGRVGGGSGGGAAPRGGPGTSGACR